MLKKPWEIESIQVDTDNEKGFLSKFIIYDDSKLIQPDFFNIAKTDDFVNGIENSQIEKGIMISRFKINNILIYLCILDNKIFIIKQINLPKFKKYFNKHLKSLMFMTAECKENFLKALSLNEQISDQNDQFLNEQKDIHTLIKNEIIQCIIKKSQYRTMQMHQESLPIKKNSKYIVIHKKKKF